MDDKIDAFLSGLATASAIVCLILGEPLWIFAINFFSALICGHSAFIEGNK